MSVLRLFNSKTHQVEDFIPINKNVVKMYVCGPTVYARPHLGNIRAAVAYDILYRLLRYLYPKVIYARNITDVDDKIIEISRKNGQDIQSITDAVTKGYHADLEALNCLKPDIEPKATEHIVEMIELIERLIQSGYAYVAEGHVLFSVESYVNYGSLSNRIIEDMIAGARVEVAPYKKNPMDFVLWKPIKDGEEDASFSNPWNSGGRPGWHTECAAMTKKHLGEEFDIHGGGIDLIFPHHENELAQSVCANNNKNFARYWVHNGFLNMGGEKMSKSLGNINTIPELMSLGFSGSALRYFYMTGHYRKPLDFTEKAISDSEKAIHKFKDVLKGVDFNKDIAYPDEIIDALKDDMNTALALSILHRYSNLAANGDVHALNNLQAACLFLGIFNEHDFVQKYDIIPDEVIQLAEQRIKARISKEWKLADDLRARIHDMGYTIKDLPNNQYTVSKIIH